MPFQIVHINETDSTNRWLKEHGSEQDMVLTTDYQSAGRGCGTNTWESERDKNLLFSILYHPTAIEANRQFLISMAVSIAIQRVVNRWLTTAEVSIKWPNDIYVDDHKICGILIENRLHGSQIKESIIGVGLNVNQTAFLSDAPNPISFAQVLHGEQDRRQILQDVLGEFSNLVEQWDEEAVKREYRTNLYRRTDYHPYRDAQGEFQARIATVEDDGHLLLHLPDGEERCYAFKEVSFII